MTPDLWEKGSVTEVHSDAPSDPNDSGTGESLFEGRTKTERKGGNLMLLQFLAHYSSTRCSLLKVGELVQGKG